MNVGVGILSVNGLWTAPFCISVINMLSVFCAIPAKESQELSILTAQGSLLPDNRELIIFQAIGASCTHHSGWPGARWKGSGVRG